MRQRIDLGVLALSPIDSAEARECVLSVDVHRTGATNAFSAGAAEGQCRVDIVLDFDEGIKDL